MTKREGIITDIQKGIKTPYTAVQAQCVICNT